MDTFLDALGDAAGKRPDLTLDPVAALIAILIILVYAGLRISGRRKSRRRQIAEMEDAEFPEGSDAFEAEEESR